MAHIESRGFGLPIFGESRYVSNLRRCYNDASSTKLDQKSVKIPVIIKPNGDVISQHGKVGEIGYDDIDDYKELYGATAHTTFCRIYTRTGKMFGAYLSLTLTEHTASKVLNKNLPNHEFLGTEKKRGFFAKLFGL
ncbi:hypothetical protein AAX09_07650 [Moraxella bovoculi]|uniref:hypothetical protein n=1 Tax=Moraxella bovoculi TaxID=386891 RepID=UPI0006249775|nr:hypothetical protein [Moraxella bovoculi]AKG19268.1 hypothetical protein AAX09_07650 [Moraxella bovoculi]